MPWICGVEEAGAKAGIVGIGCGVKVGGETGNEDGSLPRKFLIGKG